MTIAGGRRPGNGLTARGNDPYLGRGPGLPGSGRTGPRRALRITCAARSLRFVLTG
jgi:hypothetical protein